MKKVIFTSLICASLLSGTTINAQVNNNVIKINLHDFAKEYEDNGFVFHKKYDGKVLEFDTTITGIHNSCWFIMTGGSYPCIGIKRDEEVSFFGPDKARMLDDNVLYSLHADQKIKLQCLLDSINAMGQYYFKDCIVVK